MPHDTQTCIKHQCLLDINYCSWSIKIQEYNHTKNNSASSFSLSVNATANLMKTKTRHYHPCESHFSKTRISIADSQLLLIASNDNFDNNRDRSGGNNSKVSRLRLNM